MKLNCSIILSCANLIIRSAKGPREEEGTIFCPYGMVPDSANVLRQALVDYGRDLIHDHNHVLNTNIFKLRIKNQLFLLELHWGKIQLFIKANKRTIEGFYWWTGYLLQYVF